MYKQKNKAPNHAYFCYFVSLLSVIIIIVICELLNSTNIATSADTVAVYAVKPVCGSQEQNIIKNVN